MPVPERRHSPRMTLERLAYIHIEPDNGGIVLNVSDHGLCFQSIAPVVQDDKLRFSLLEQNHRIEVDAQVMWMDQGQTVAGLRFASLSAEAREQIRNWMTESHPPSEDHRALPTSVLAATSPPLVAHLPESLATTLPFGSRMPVSSETRRHEFRAGFSGGLAIGLLLAGLVTAGFLFHNYRHELGRSLIGWGQRLAADSSAPQFAAPPTLTPPTFPRPSIPTPVMTPVSPPVPPVVNEQAPLPEDRTERIRTGQPTITPLQVKTGYAAPSTAVAARSLPAPPPLTLPGVPPANLSKLLSDEVSTLPHVEIASRAADAGVRAAQPPSHMYFEVGKFKEPLGARKTTSDLLRLGFPTTTTEKGGLWKNSYYVLVGPYSDHEQTESVHKKLAALGFKPRAFERGSRHFTLSSPVTLNSTLMPVGDFLISWESYVPEARVKFTQDDYVVARAEGRWIERGTRTVRDTFVYQKNVNGSHSLLEIRFAGTSKVLLFRNPS